MRKRNGPGGAKTLGCALLCAWLILGACAAQAEKRVTGLGTGSITNPTPAENSNSPWSGSYVYYGQAGGSPVKYRVLDKASADFGGTTLLLDCDAIFNHRFNDEPPFSNVWNGSKAQTWLNGEFLSGFFTEAEAAAIAASTKSGKVSGDGDGWDRLGFARLEGEKIFLLDAVEATRPSYGYYNGTAGGTDSGRRKKRRRPVLLVASVALLRQCDPCRQRV